MTNIELSEGISLIAFVLFTALLVIGTMSTLIRALRYSHARQEWPRLLLRDLIWQGCLGLDFALILGVRFAGIGPRLVGNVVWVVVTSALALIGAGTYAYYEIAVIEKPPSPSIRDRLLAPKDEKPQ